MQTGAQIPPHLGFDFRLFSLLYLVAIVIVVDFVFLLFSVVIIVVVDLIQAHSFSRACTWEEVWLFVRRGAGKRGGVRNTGDPIFSLPSISFLFFLVCVSNAHSTPSHHFNGVPRQWQSKFTGNGKSFTKEFYIDHLVESYSTVSPWETDCRY